MSCVATCWELAPTQLIMGISMVLKASRITEHDEKFEQRETASRSERSFHDRLPRNFSTSQAVCQP